MYVGCTSEDLQNSTTQEGVVITHNPRTCRMQRLNAKRRILTKRKDEASQNEQSHEQCSTTLDVFRARVCIVLVSDDPEDLVGHTTQITHCL